MWHSAPPSTNSAAARGEAFWFGGGSMEVERSSGTFTAEMVESLRFEEEIQSLIHPSFDDGSPASGDCSFTALLGLPANQAVELLHDPPASAALEQWRGHLGEHGAPATAPIHLPPGCSPTYPSNAALVERAARFSEFAAAEDSPSSSSGGGCPSPQGLKVEPPDSDSPALLPVPAEKPQQRPTKRKDSDESKAKGTTKKSKRTEADNAAEESTGGDKLPYVHVRARRGQATDSHSLAERARREKINARMKLLQELVPGCCKITGTALVLDEIINHVQSLQRQVEFLSMRLAAVNPTIDFADLESFLSAESGSLPAANGRVEAASDPTSWPSDTTGVRRLPPHKLWHVDLVCAQQSSTVWERDHHVLDLVTPLFPDESANSVPVNSINQLKTEL